MITRREFLTSAGVAAGALLAGGPRAARSASPTRSARAPLDLLILGGTGFIGPHLVRHAIGRGHRVSIFTRGRRDGSLPDGVTRLVGDRNGQLDALAGKRWDAVVDDSATNPAWVRLSAAALATSVGRYLFTSSTGVYYPYRTARVDETTAPHTDPIDANDQDEAYGVSKAQCEREVQRVFGDRATVVRPTYIVGPGDTSDRFPYWVARLAQPGPILIPGKRDDLVQWIDVRDLAAFYITLIENGRAGVYNGVGAQTTIASQRFFETVRATLNPAATYTVVDDYELLAKRGIVEVVPWVLPAGNTLHATSVASTRSTAAGLTLRPLADTLRDTAAWWRAEPEARRLKPRFAITPDLEASVLREWKARVG